MRRKELLLRLTLANIGRRRTSTKVGNVAQRWAKRWPQWKRHFSLRFVYTGCSALRVALPCGAARHRNAPHRHASRVNEPLRLYFYYTQRRITIFAGRLFHYWWSHPRNCVDRSSCWSCLHSSSYLWFCVSAATSSTVKSYMPRTLFVCLTIYSWGGYTFWTNRQYITEWY